MKAAILFSFLMFSHTTLANTVAIGCNEQMLMCPPERECVWMTNLGQTGEVQLVKDVVGPDYEIWKGHFAGLIYDQYPFEVVFSQKINTTSGEKTNYLSIKLKVDNAEISSSGISRVSAKYREENFGVGFICASELIPDESNF